MFEPLNILDEKDKEISMSVELPDALGMEKEFQDVIGDKNEEKFEEKVVTTDDEEGEEVEDNDAAQQFIVLEETKIEDYMSDSEE